MRTLASRVRHDNCLVPLISCLQLSHFLTYRKNKNLFREPSKSAASFSALVISSLLRWLRISLTAKALLTTPKLSRRGSDPEGFAAQTSPTQSARKLSETGLHRRRSGSTKSWMPCRRCAAPPARTGDGEPQA